MKTVDLDEVTRNAVNAALAVIDEAADGTCRRSDGPCGDALAGTLDDIIRKAVKAHFDHPDYAPAFVRLSED